MILNAMYRTFSGYAAGGAVGCATNQKVAGSIPDGVIEIFYWHSCRQPQTYVKPEAAITVFELLMMGGVSAETCWAIKKHWNNKFYYTVASCWFFLWVLYYGARIHEHQHSAVLVDSPEGLPTNPESKIKIKMSNL